jgi:hypothetical protein
MVYKYGTAILLTLIFLFILAVYKEFIFLRYEYMGFRLVGAPVNVYLSLVVFVFLIVVMLLLPLKPIVFATSSIIKFMFLIPALVLFSKMDADIRILISVVVFDLGFLFLSFYRTNVKTIKISTKQGIVILLILLLILLIPIIRTFGTSLDYNLLFMENIYESRMKARAVDNILSGYSVFWLCKVIIPVLLIYGLIRKNVALVAINIVALLFIFMISGAHKSLFFSLFVILFFYLFKSYYKKVFMFLAAVVLLMITGLYLFFYSEHTFIADMLIRRTILDPPLMDIFYFDFFDNNHMYLSHSIFKDFVDNPYDIQPSYVIGGAYLKNPANNAGSGIIGDGFMNYGSIGVLASLLIAVIILNYVTKAKMNPGFFGLIFIVLYGFSATGILTNLMNGGIIILIFLIQFMMKNYKKSSCCDV